MRGNQQFTVLSHLAALGSNIPSGMPCIGARSYMHTHKPMHSYRRHRTKHNILTLLLDVEVRSVRIETAPYA